MMIQLLIQFQKYILSTIYIYISFYLWVFQLKVIPKYRWTFLDDTIPLTYPSRDFHTHTHIRARDIRSGRELFPFSIHVSWGDVLEESDASSLPRKMERMREEEKRKRNDGVFFFSGPWRVESARLKYRAGGIMLRQRWVNGDVDRRKFHSAHGRARRSMFQLGKKWKNRRLGEKLVCSFWFKKLPTFVIGYITKEDLSIVPWIVLLISVTSWNDDPTRKTII